MPPTIINDSTLDPIVSSEAIDAKLPEASLGPPPTKMRLDNQYHSGSRGCTAFRDFILREMPFDPGEGNQTQLEVVKREFGAC